MSASLWRYHDVALHWDQLVLSARVQQNGDWRPYQSGTLAGLRHPTDLIARFAGGPTLPDSSAMFGGTMATLPPIAWADAFEAVLHDPILGRTLVCRYTMTALPIVD